MVDSVNLLPNLSRLAQAQSLKTKSKNQTKLAKMIKHNHLGTATKQKRVKRNLKRSKSRVRQQSQRSSPAKRPLQKRVLQKRKVKRNQKKR